MAVRDQLGHSIIEFRILFFTRARTSRAEVEPISGCVTEGLLPVMGVIDMISAK